MKPESITRWDAVALALFAGWLAWVAGVELVGAAPEPVAAEALEEAPLWRPEMEPRHARQMQREAIARLLAVEAARQQFPDGLSRSGYDHPEHGATLRAAWRRKVKLIAEMSEIAAEELVPEPVSP